MAVLLWGPLGRCSTGRWSGLISRAEVYLTNAVKHFRYSTRGKRRIHERPTRSQVAACLPWLQVQLESRAPQALSVWGDGGAGTTRCPGAHRP